MFSSGGPSVRFLTRYDGEVSEPLVGRQGKAWCLSGVPGGNHSSPRGSGHVDREQGEELLVLFLISLEPPPRKSTRPYKDARTQKKLKTIPPPPPRAPSPSRVCAARLTRPRSGGAVPGLRDGPPTVTGGPGSGFEDRSPPPPGSRTGDPGVAVTRAPVLRPGRRRAGSIPACSPFRTGPPRLPGAAITDGGDAQA